MWKLSIKRVGIKCQYGVATFISCFCFFFKISSERRKFEVRWQEQKSWIVIWSCVARVKYSANSRACLDVLSETQTDLEILKQILLQFFRKNTSLVPCEFAFLYLGKLFFFKTEKNSFFVADCPTSQNFPLIQNTLNMTSSSYTLFLSNSLWTRKFQKNT